MVLSNWGGSLRARNVGALQGQLRTPRLSPPPSGISTSSLLTRHVPDRQEWNSFYKEEVRTSISIKVEKDERVHSDSANGMKDVCHLVCFDADGERRWEA